MSKYWFRSKYGLGWYPTTFKGFLILFLYFSFLLFIFYKINSASSSVTNTIIAFAPYFFGATIILLFICYITGEPLRKLKI